MLYIQQIIKKNIFQNKIDTPFKANIFHYTWWSLGRDQAKACERENFWFYFRENNDLWSYIRLQIEWETYIILSKLTPLLYASTA